MKPDISGVLEYNTMYEDVDVPTKVVFEPSPSYFYDNLLEDSNRYNRLILIHGLEPPLYNNISELIISNYKLFTEIYTSDMDVLNSCNNSTLFLFGSCWILTDNKGTRVETISNYCDYYNIFDKKFKMSFINSGKSQLPGHTFRNSISEYFKKYHYNIELLFPNERVDTKIHLFEDSMFHIAVENSQVINYFTEKIIDCFMSRTIPIYWGCPNIEDFFNINGIIQFKSIKDLDNILYSLTDEEYSKKIQAIEDNYGKAKQYAFFYDRINKILKYEY
jgi:hypothetical protein